MMIDTNKLARQIKKGVAKMEPPKNDMVYNSEVFAQWRRLAEKEENLKFKVRSMENEIYSSNLAVDSLEMKILCQELFLLKIQHYRLLKSNFECVACLRRNLPEAQIMDDANYVHLLHLATSLFNRIKSEYHLQWCEDEDCEECQSEDDDRPPTPSFLRNERPYVPIRHSTPPRLPYFRFERDEDPNDEDPC